MYNASDKYDVTIFTIYGNGNLEKDVDKRVKIITYEC